MGDEAIIADELADDGAVLLLDVGAVVLLPGATAGKGDAVASAPIVEAVVDELRAVVAVETDEGNRQPLPDVMDRPAHAPLTFAPDGFELDPHRGDVHGAEGAEVEALGTAAAVGDQIDLAEAGARVVPLGEGADRDLLPEPGPGARARGAPARILRTGRGQQAGERRAAGLAQALLDVRGHGQFAVLNQAVEQLGHEGVQPMGPDPAARLPQDLGGRRDRRAILARPAARAGRAARARGAAQQSDGGLAVDARDRHDLVQELSLLGTRALQVALPLDRGVFPKAGSCHGLLPTGVGNRDC